MEGGKPKNLQKIPGAGQEPTTNSTHIHYATGLELNVGCIGGRGSPIGFSGSGIWLISRPGFGILKEKGDEIRDCNYDRNTGFGDFNRLSRIQKCRFKETKIREFQRLKYAKKIKLPS